MRFLFAAVLLLLPLSAQAGEKVTFTHAPLSGNQTVVQSEDLRMDFGIDIFMGEANLGTMRAENVEGSLLTAKLGKWNDKKKTASLSYGKCGEKETQTTPDGKTEVKDEPSLLSGKSYDVTWEKGGEPVIVYSGGGAPEGEELALVRKDWDDLTSTEPSDFEAALVGQTVEVGSPLSSDGAVMAKLLSLDDDELTVKDAKMTLREVAKHNGEQCGIFDLELTIVGNDAEMSMTMAAKGEAIVSVNGLRAHAVSLAGPITLAASIEEDGMKMTMTGGGSFNFGLTNTFGK